MEEDIETCGWFVFYKDQLLIEKKNGMYTIPFGTEPPMPVPVGSTIHTIGEIEGRTAKTFSVHAPVPGSENDRHLMMDLRSSYDVLPWEEYNVGGKAFPDTELGQEQPLLPHVRRTYRTDFSYC